MTGQVDGDAGLLAETERDRLRAIVAGDAGRLWRLHHPEFLLCSPGGTVWDRATYVGGLVDGSIRYSRFEPVTPIEVLHSAGLAVLRYRSVIDLVTPRGGGHLECWHLDTYVRHEGRWQCRWSQATDTITD